MNALTSHDRLTDLARCRNLMTWEELIIYVRELPYGRHDNRKDFSLVFAQEKGTCSSKHALLKTIADHNDICDVKLILGIYIMNAINTTRIAHVLSAYNIESLPEAHCYLKVHGKTLDCTTSDSDFMNIEKDVIQEIEIVPEQVSEFKVDYHQAFLKKWIPDNNINYSFKKLWMIREECIKSLETQC